jgi:hypothetical protein
MRCTDHLNRLLSSKKKGEEEQQRQDKENSPPTSSFGLLEVIGAVCFSNSWACRLQRPLNAEEHLVRRLRKMAGRRWRVNPNPLQEADLEEHGHTAESRIMTVLAFIQKKNALLGIASKLVMGFLVAGIVIVHSFLPYNAVLWFHINITRCDLLTLSFDVTEFVIFQQYFGDL